MTLTTSPKEVRSSCHEHNEYDEEDDEHAEDFDHEPAIRRHWLEVFEELGVGCLHIHEGVFYIRVNPVEKTRDT